VPKKTKKIKGKRLENVLDVLLPMKGRFTHDQLLDCIWIFLHNRLQVSKRLHSHVEILVRNVTHQQRQLLWDTAVGKTRFLQRIHDVFKTYTAQSIIKS